MFKKKILVTFALTILSASIAFFATDVAATNSEAATPYLGLKFGRVTMNYKADQWSKVKSTSTEEHKFVGRACLGYAFSEFLAGEFGYTYFDKPTFREDNSGLKKSFYQYGYDLTGIASIPFQHGLGLYGKAGLTWIFRGALAGDQYFFDYSANNKLTELLGAGLFYDFNRHFSSDIAWTRIFPNGDLPKMDLFTLGLTLKFKG